MRARTPIVLLFAAVFVLAGNPAFAGGGTTEQQVAESLTCQCGCGLTVANCNHPNCEFSVPMRQQIDTMIAHGQGRAEIVAFFRQKYGEKILSAPTTQGFNVLAWVMPFIAIVFGGAVVVITVGRWRNSSENGRKPDSSPSSGDTPSGASAGPMDAELRKRLERELKERL